jgi:hypothetical protein
MKKINFKLSVRSLKGIFLISILTLLVSSCQDDTEEYIAAHDQKFEAMKVEYGMTEANAIGDGIYMRFIGDTTTAVHPGALDYVMVSLVGLNSAGDLIDVTDSADAAANDIFREDLVYGPVRLNVDNTFTGFNIAVQKMPEGSYAMILFPYDLAFGGYEPIVYKVKLYKVIPNLEQYIDAQFETYVDILKDSLGIITDNYDSIPGFRNAYSIITKQGTEDVELSYGDSATIELHAYYVETDPTYVHEFPGRSFFPINNSGDTITFDIGSVSFPISDLINAVVPIMKLGERREIVSPSEYVYDNQGFVHPYVGSYIVPPYMDVHYSIELIATPELK